MLEGITIEPQENGVTIVKPARPAFPACVAYWEREAPFGQDRWRYQLTNGETYSHPTEYGCQIMARKHFIDIEAIILPEGFDGLDETDKIIGEMSVAAWNRKPADKPRVGDYLKLSDGTYSRVTMRHQYGAQIGGGEHGSYYLGKDGSVSYSGGLDPSVLYECFKPTDETKRGRFWFFHHGIAGGGRGVDFWVECRVFQYQKITMTEEQARAHPSAKRCAEFWGENNREHLRVVQGLMEGKDL